MLEETDMKHRKYKLNVAVVTNTIGHMMPTCLASACLIAYTHPSVKDTTDPRLSSGHIVYVSRDDLELGQINDLLLRHDAELDPFAGQQIHTSSLAHPAPWLAATYTSSFIARVTRKIN